MRTLRQISDQEVWCEFAAAEVDSPRYGPAFAAAVGEDAAHRLRTRPVESWTDEDRRVARAGVWAIRAGYVAPLFAIGMAWFLARLQLEELYPVLIINFDRFKRVAPSRQLLDFVKALDAGVFPPGDSFGEGYRRLRTTFEPARVRGHPILVGTTTDSRFTEVEGLTRMSCLLSRHLAGEPTSSEIEVVVGLSSRVTEWVWF